MRLARLDTCWAHYQIDKAKNALGGLRWIEPGGGSYSICNKQLKMSAKGGA